AYRITHGAVDPGIVSGLPRPLDGLVTRALQVAPELRPTARDLLLAMVGGGGGDSEAAVLNTLNQSWNRPLAAEAYDLIRPSQPPLADLPGDPPTADPGLGRPQGGGAAGPRQESPIEQPQTGAPTATSHDGRNPPGQQAATQRPPGPHSAV